MKRNKPYMHKVMFLMFLLLVCSFVAIPVEAKVKKNDNDVKALKQIIKQQRKRGAVVPQKMNGWSYKWDKKTGRLVEINWEKVKLKGTVDFNRLKALKQINCGSNKITHLYVNRLKSLKYLYCNKNQLKGIKVTRLKNLNTLDCSNNKLKSLNLSNNVNVRYLTFQYNKIEKINLKKLKKLKFLLCDNNELKVLDLSKCERLYYGVDCSKNQLTKLKLKNYSAISYLDCSNNQLENLNLDYIYEIQAIYCRYNKIKKLDLTHTDQNLLYHVEVDYDVEVVGWDRKAIY